MYKRRRNVILSFSLLSLYESICMKTILLLQSPSAHFLRPTKPSVCVCMGVLCMCVWLYTNLSLFLSFLCRVSLFICPSICVSVCTPVLGKEDVRDLLIRSQARWRRKTLPFNEVTDLVYLTSRAQKNQSRVRGLGNCPRWVHRERLLVRWLWGHET